MAKYVEILAVKSADMFDPWNPNVGLGEWTATHPLNPTYNSWYTHAHSYKLLN